MPAPSVIVFDVNETLSDLKPMSQRFADIGLPDQLAQTWFAQVLRDGFALAAAGGSATFSTIAEGVLRSLFPQHAPDRDPDEAVQHVLDGFSSLQVHPDVPAGVRALADDGLRLVTLTNGGDAARRGAPLGHRRRRPRRPADRVDRPLRWGSVPAVPHQARSHGVGRRRPGAQGRRTHAASYLTRTRDVVTAMQTGCPLLGPRVGIP